MKNQALFSSKDKSKLKFRLLQFLFGALSVNFSPAFAVVNLYFVICALYQ